VLSPALAGVPEAGHLAQASTFCGRCEEVCPVEIPLVSLMRTWREAALAQPSSWKARAMLRGWAFFARRPRLYRLAARIAAGMLARLGRGTGRLAWLPMGERWTRDRDFPAPEGRTFQDAWARRIREPGP
jgi:L-lactate dehydrogenase complex protein LldF